ncbi:iron uptake transporter deferrochelatase/peroxidase subunit [Pseudomonas psychrophila]|uniref:Deferrochelatase n=1 Tax=Pseudomonas psychrophila TaxID=122355 RepID=A0ABY0VWW6_9PSED|nr:iron uptake transporter deferrochelatase/peroxidase subunit [Pseudomonas psychrophila]KAB0492261.1 deferrochelatase/peroxidase EfeB [Pseudomonas psychrophila]KMM99437.1 peroxidase [Pseudomonas psychrophila]QIE33422.1 deferrochelatase/peroxidase EfeB [Pseudomonas psychrophila]WVI99988.1 iron uptake transporter deferrochelatase/peroxidase subunit [Pseudomonas psychrophila]SDU60827.1 deferrochelatase/peroxidase EfeB [Pseudomonas psychrophila]
MSDSEHTPTPFNLQRRRILMGMGVAGAALAGGALSCPAMAAGSPADAQVTQAPSSDKTLDHHDFHGQHQNGIVTPRPAAGMLVSFDVLATDRQDLERLFHTLNERIAFLMKGGTVPLVDPKLPPVDSGILGPVVTPDNLTVTVSVGESLFDQRFGLSQVKPKRLSRMQGFPNDALEPAQCHGDLSLQFCANTADTNIHALRDIVKNLPDLLLVRWKQEGTVPPQAPAKPGVPAQSARNFLGFRDGSANPDSNNNTAMNQIVWVLPGSDEPQWAVNGSYQAVRIIRNFVERWDRTPLQEQESIFGRSKASGAPMDGIRESDVPDYNKDPHGKITKMDAHIRLANPRTAQTRNSLILRRPFNYSNGVNKNGQLDMGLLFICYQRDLEQGFIAVQTRLNGEPLEEYLKPVGGGYFFTLPGVRDDQDFIGRSLLDAATPLTRT